MVALPFPQRTMAHAPDNFAIALAGSALGHRFVPCAPGTKVPLVKWKRFQEEAPTPELYERWFRGTRNNIALLTGGMVLFDCDDPAKAELVLRACGETPWQLRTPRGGVHLGYRRRQGVAVTNRVKIKGQPIDIRTDGGLEMVPNSATEHGAYSWLGEGLIAIAELPVAKVGWTRERTRRRAARCLIEDEPEACERVRRARAYLARIEGAVSGQRGHDRTFRVACLLTQRFGLSFAEAWPLLLEWNERCHPPWSERELIHKLQDSLKRKG
jgi:hypothetical protein